MMKKKKHFNHTRHSISDIKFEVASFVYLHIPPDSEDGSKIRILLLLNLYDCSDDPE